MNHKSIQESYIVHVATKCANTVYFSLTQNHYAEPNDAREIAKDCGDRVAQILTLMLSERGVQVIPEKVA